MTKWHTKSIREHLSALESNDTNATDLAQYYLERIETHASVNAIVHLDREYTLNCAKSPKTGALSGLPIAHKDLFATQALNTTCASQILSGYQSPFDATIVERLFDAGVIMLGKSNMDEFAMGSSNENSSLGACQNPWATDRVPGGSSGGSAAAVAAGLTPAATGSDTGGSIRQPAAFCGVTGIKPTYGAASRFGMVAFASSFDQAGVIAKSSADCAQVLEPMLGHDPRDSTSLEFKPQSLTDSLDASIKGLRIGIPKALFDHELPSDIRTCIDTALAQYEQLGATLVDIDLPHSDLSIPAYYVLTMAEASSNLSRFDGVRYGARAENYTDLNDMYQRTRSEGFGEEVKRRILMGTYVLSESTFDAYFVKAQKIRRLINNDFAAAFEACDIIVSPTTPTTAFKIGEKSDDPVSMYLSDIFTVPINLAGLPAMNHPIGFDNQNLPVGLQLIGQRLDEARLLNVAHQYQQHTPWHTLTPEAFQ